MNISVELERYEFECITQLSEELGYGCPQDYLHYILWRAFAEELARYGIHWTFWPDSADDLGDEDANEMEHDDFDDSILN